MRAMSHFALRSGASIVLCTMAACSNDTATTPPNGAPALGTSSGAYSEPDDPGDEPGDDEGACEDEPDPGPDDSRIICLTLQRDWIGDVADASTGRGRSERPEKETLTVSGGADGARQALLRFDTDRLPQGAVVVSATLTLDTVEGGRGKLGVYNVLDDWRESDVGPDTRVALDREPVAQLVGGGRASADLAPLAQAWLDRRVANRGIALTLDDGTSVFVSSEAPIRYQRPSLEICLEPLDNKGDMTGPEFDKFVDELCGGNSPLDYVELCAPDKEHPTSFCANVGDDEKNCGACGKACGKAEMCVFGTCVDGGKGEEICQAFGQSMCAGSKSGQVTCEDLGRDNDNCGSCGNACLETQFCQKGECTCGAAPWTVCDGTCADLGWDDENCGACGNACDANHQCISGVCLAPSDYATVGDKNARWLSFGGGAMNLFRSDAYQRRWTHVTSTFTSSGTPALFFYDRNSGDVKLVSYTPSGALATLGTHDDFRQDWDIIVAPRMSTDYNLEFFDRASNELKTVDARDNGTFVKIDSAIMPPADGSATFKDPERHAWNNVVPMRVPLASAANDAVFLYHQMSGHGWFLTHSRSATTGDWSWTIVKKMNMSNVWDQIAAGDFDGDGADDLVFYDQDTGRLKLLFVDGSFEAKSGLELPDEGTAHGAQLVAGHFDTPNGQWVREDFLLYRSDNGDAFENGRVRMWKDQADGTRVVSVDDGQVLDGWTHLVPVTLGGAHHDGLLMYSNQQVIDVTFYPFVSKDPGGPWNWTLNNKRSSLRHQNALRKTYAPAGLAFHVTLNPTAMVFEKAAKYLCIKNNPDRDPVNDFITANVPSTTLPIVLATESSKNGTGCSGRHAEFVREKLFYDNTAPWGLLVEAHSAHEIGHYFGLGHSHIGAASDKKVDYDEAWLTKKLGASGDVYKLDTDANQDPDGWKFVWDSPPSLVKRWWTDQGLASDKTSIDKKWLDHLRCPAPGWAPEETFQNGNGDDVTLTLYPPVISGYGVCRGSNGYGFGRLSRDQIRAVRGSLYHERKALLGP